MVDIISGGVDFFLLGIIMLALYHILFNKHEGSHAAYASSGDSSRLRRDERTGRRLEGRETRVSNAELRALSGIGHEEEVLAKEFEMELKDVSIILHHVESLKPYYNNTRNYEEHAHEIKDHMTALAITGKQIRELIVKMRGELKKEKRKENMLRKLSRIDDRLMRKLERDLNDMGHLHFAELASKSTDARNKVWRDDHKEHKEIRDVVVKVSALDAREINVLNELERKVLGLILNFLSNNKQHLEGHHPVTEGDLGFLRSLLDQLERTAHHVIEETHLILELEHVLEQELHQAAQAIVHLEQGLHSQVEGVLDEAHNAENHHPPPRSGGLRRPHRGR